jgi:hypothetical protein
VVAAWGLQATLWNRSSAKRTHVVRTIETDLHTLHPSDIDRRDNGQRDPDGVQSRYVASLHGEVIVFYYFGRKGRLASSYPAPVYDLVIEPFAGSMAYSLHHRPNLALGLEANKRVVDLWHRLSSMTASEIKALRPPDVCEVTTDLYWILASASGSALEMRYRKVTWFMADRFEKQKRMTVRHIGYAPNHVLYRWADYWEAPDIEATWFVDPPYETITGYGNDGLAEWCLTRRGQVIVCEGANGSWLPFTKHRKSVRSTKSISEDIRNVEGFDVRFVGVDGEDVSLRRAEDYPSQRAARNAWTVSRWKRERFEVAYPDYRRSGRGHRSPRPLAGPRAQDA